MKNKMKILIIFVICLAIIPSFVFAFGEVTGPVIFYVPIGSSNVSSWGISNNEATVVTLSAEGDIAKFINLPSNVTLQSNQIYWINITANIPSDYNTSNGTNITGTFYALQQGQPGQVQINLRLKKNAYILVEQPQALTLEQQNIFVAGLFALETNPSFVAVITGIIVLFGIVLFVKKKWR